MRPESSSSRCLPPPPAPRAWPQHGSRRNRWLTRASEWRRLLDSGEVSTRAGLARRFGVWCSRSKYQLLLAHRDPLAKSKWHRQQRRRELLSGGDFSIQERYPPERPSLDVSAFRERASRKPFAASSGTLAGNYGIGAPRGERLGPSRPRLISSGIRCRCPMLVCMAWRTIRAPASVRR